MPADILVFAELSDGQPKKSSREALGAAHRIVNELGGGKVTALVAGSGVDSAAAGSLARFGANSVLVADNAAFTNYSPGGFAAAMAAAVAKTNPAAVLLPGTALGRDLAPRVAARVESASASDVVEISVEDGSIKAVRPSYGGKIMMKVAFAKAPAVLCLRPNVFETLPEDSSKSASPAALDFSLTDKDLALKVTAVEKKASDIPDVAESDLVVSGGRGMREGEGFALLEQLATELGAGIGASRAAVDSGWRPHSDQVGQTGKFVSPSLYVAVGISGAVQHLAGMIGSKCIVAINKDPEAPIFKVANYGIVGDAFEVVPALVEELKKNA